MTSQNERANGYYRANRIGALLALMTLCQYAVPALLFWLLRAVWDIDTSARAFGLTSAKYLCVYAGVYILMMGIPLVFGSRITGQHRTALSPLNLSLDRKICVVLCGTALCILCNLLSTALREIGSRIGIPFSEPVDMGDGSVLTLLMDLVVFAVLPAVMEEALLRGVVLQTIRPLGNGIAVIVSATAFGLMHGSLDQVPYALLMGLVLGAVFVYTDDLSLTVMIHALANALSVVSSFWSQFYATPTAILWQGLLLLTVLLLGLLAVLWLRRHPLTRSRPVYDRSVRERWRVLMSAPLLWGAAALMLVLMIIGNLV